MDVLLELGVSDDVEVSVLTDILVLDETASAAFLYAGMGNRSFASAPLVIQTSGGAKELVLGDLDQDGCLDIVARTVSGVTVLRNQTCDAGIPEEEAGEEGEESGEEGEESGENVDEEADAGIGEDEADAE